MKKKVKLIGVAVVVMVILGIGVYSYLQPLAVETKTLEKSESEITFTESGVIVNSHELKVYPKVAGEVEEIAVQEGDRVKKGDILAVLDHKAIDLQIKQLEETMKGYEAQLQSAEIDNAQTIDRLKANRNDLYGQLKTLEAGEKSEGELALEATLIDQSKRVYDQGVEDLDKYKELYDKGYISESDYTNMQTLVDGYEAAYEKTVVAAESQEDYYDGMKTSIYAQIDSINKTLDKDMLTSTKAYYQSLIDGTKVAIEAAKNSRQELYIQADIDGKVDQINIDQVNVVSNTAPAFVLLGDGELKVEVGVNTRDIDTVHVGDIVRLKLDRRTGDIEFEGTITKISESAVVEVSPLGIEERKVTVTILPDSQDHIQTGYDIDVLFPVYKAGDSLVVPNNALYKKEGKDMVMIVENGKTKEAEVSLGYELTGERIVEKGLEEGMQIIVDLDAKGLKVGSNVVSSNE